MGYVVCEIQCELEKLFIENELMCFIVNNRFVWKKVVDVENLFVGEDWV